jgi:hypothetical protein
MGQPERGSFRISSPVVWGRLNFPGLLGVTLDPLHAQGQPAGDVGRHGVEEHLLVGMDADLGGHLVFFASVGDQGIQGQAQDVLLGDSGGDHLFLGEVPHLLADVEPAGNLPAVLLHVQGVTLLVRCLECPRFCLAEINHPRQALRPRYRRLHRLITVELAFSRCIPVPVGLCGVGDGSTTFNLPRVCWAGERTPGGVMRSERPGATAGVDPMRTSAKGWAQSSRGRCATAHWLAYERARGPSEKRTQRLLLLPKVSSKE